MSTFSGKLHEFPSISIDHFSGPNLHSKAFFLSHCHQDHMHGIDSSEFLQHLTTNNHPLYMSHISAEILRNMHPKLSPFVRELDMHFPSTVEIADSESFSVLTIPAGHCPGSVMFLFEARQMAGSVLYTGDFRINPRDVAKIKAFYTTFNEKKRIQSVYLDTTFFLKTYSRFPTRAHSLEEICTIISGWVSKSPMHVVNLAAPARYGYEYLFSEIYKRFKMPIHVNDEAYEFYSKVPELAGAVTKSVNHPTQLHTACGEVYTKICRESISNINVVTIKVSAMRWTSNETAKSGISGRFWPNYHVVCYSTHASYEECRALLDFLQPIQVFPSVLWNKEVHDKEIWANIKEVVGNNDDAESEQDQIAKPAVELFCYENTKPKVISVEESEELGSILDSPPVKRRAKDISKLT